MSTEREIKSDSIGRLLDEKAISDLIIRVGRAQDTRNWGLYESCFADRILVEQPMDPTWTPREVPSHEWAQRAASTLDGFDLTHHCLFNFLIDVDEGTARAEVDLVARHEIDDVEGGIYTLGGRYHIALRMTNSGWKITSRRLEVRWESGNTSLMQTARRRVSEGGSSVPRSFR